MTGSPQPSPAPSAESGTVPPTPSSEAVSPTPDRSPLAAAEGDAAGGSEGGGGEPAWIAAVLGLVVGGLGGFGLRRWAATE